jgi:adenine-specific DNA-methyltransferase
MSEFYCGICQKTFQIKSQLTSHQNRKTPCKAPINEVIVPELKKDLGQFFTVADSLQTFIFDHVKHRGSTLLEPSFGAGHLLKLFLQHDPNYPMVCYELDHTIVPVVPFNEHQMTIYADFTKQQIRQRYKTIIGNPPYIKQSSGNLYIKFIEQCYELLEPDGELLFIVPSDFFKLTSASTIITKLAENGSFTDVLFPHDETLFKGANIDVTVFRYEKNLKKANTTVNGKSMLCNVNNGIITFSDSEQTGRPLSDTFDVYVGLVSGRDEIYRVPFGNVDVLSDKDRVDRFIFPETYPTNNKAIDDHLLANKEALLERKIRKFSESNWFEWGAPRNLTAIRANLGKPCIYVKNITRSKEVSFLGHVQFFGGGLLCLIPKQTMTEKALQGVIDFLNSETVQKDYLYANRFKIGHKQVSNILLRQ